MGKYVRAIVIGLFSGLAIEVLFRNVIEADSRTSIYIGFGLGALIAVIFANLAGNRKVAAADAGERGQAMAMTPPAGKALLIPYREGFVAKLAGLNLAIDGREFAQLLSPQFTCLVLTPGSHTLTGAFGGFAGAQNKAASWAFEAPPGSVTMVRIDSEMGLIQGSVKFRPEPDPQAMKAKLDRMRMASADVKEI